MAPARFFRTNTPGALARAAGTAERQSQHNAAHPQQPTSSWDVVTRTIDNADGDAVAANAKESALAAGGLGVVGVGLSVGGVATTGGAMAIGGTLPFAGAVLAGVAYGARSARTIAEKVKLKDSHGASSAGMQASMGQQLDAMKEIWASMPEGALGKIGAGMGLLVAAEQMISSIFSMIPFPALPAVRILDMDVGLPHIHAHPPNLIPPAPPIALPSTGPIIPIPILSGANQTVINSMPAARCGDLGLGIWCGGFFPMYEVFLGSSSVWIEGSRAARVFVDITKHCIFTSPRAQDPPTGPMVGFTVSSSPNVLIGGAPMPSLTALAVGGMMKGLFRAFGSIFRKATAKGFVNRLLQKQAIEIVSHGDAAFHRAALDDLAKIAKSRTGRKMLRDLEKNLAKNLTPTNVRINKLPPGHPFGDACFPDNNLAGVSPKAKPPGTGQGTGSAIYYDPHGWPKAAGPGSKTPSDAVLFHELNHSKNLAGGNSPGHMQSSSGAWNQKNANFEEFNTTNADNTYRAEQGYKQRGHYTKPLP